MATHKSAEKQNRRNLKRRLMNRQHRSRMKTEIKKLLKAIENKEQDLATSLLPRTLSVIDKTAKYGIIHTNTADRYKSSLTRKFNAMGGTEDGTAG
jgi:small subunit ribosomal protein S20